MGLNIGGAAPESKPEEPKVEAVAIVKAVEFEPVRWTTHPIARYTVGDYQFVNGLLTLNTPEEADAFQATYDSLPVYEQTRIKKIDLAAAEALVRERLNTGGGATQGIDSATGDRAPNAAVGEGVLNAEQ